MLFGCFLFDRASSLSAVSSVFSSSGKDEYNDRDEKKDPPEYQDGDKRDAVYFQRADLHAGIFDDEREIGQTIDREAGNGRDESIVAHAADTEFGREYQKISEKRFPRFFYPNRAPLCIIDIRAFV